MKEIPNKITAYFSVLTYGGHAQPTSVADPEGGSLQPPSQPPIFKYQMKLINLVSVRPSYQVYTYSIPGVFAQGAKHPLLDYLSFL